ncbi:hypothetical protein [Mycolicibacterium goodii]|uniref:hypothetical protein n=1 Tax=Mycolicibacterium goodii TaxID=134601 RepID=UPI001BDBDB58|nr:hypothetical protein [Mycolicibacterium goodii]MBU8834151.1 hypothetical protein [Mycolicibacterium goodii]
MDGIRRIPELKIPGVYDSDEGERRIDAALARREEQLRAAREHNRRRNKQARKSRRHNQKREK